jgi:hypothetical protein
VLRQTVSIINLEPSPSIALSDVSKPLMNFGSLRKRLQKKFNMYIPERNLDLARSVVSGLKSPIR